MMKLPRFTLACIGIALALAGIEAASAFAFTPSASVVDNFNRANGGLGANWAVGPQNSCTMSIATNQVTGCGSGTSSGTESFQTVYNADSESYVTVVTPPTTTSNEVGVSIRLGNAKNVFCVWKPGTPGTYSAGYNGSINGNSIGTNADSLQAGDKIALWASGNYVECDRWISSSSQWVAEIASRISAVINQSGEAGIIASSDSTVDDFGAGNDTNATVNPGYPPPVTTTTVTTTTTLSTVTSTIYTTPSTITTGGGGGSTCGDSSTTACVVDIASNGTTAGFLNNLHDDIFVVIGVVLGAALIPLIIRWFTGMKDH